MKIKLRENKIFILVVFILLGLIFISFFQYYKDNFSYAKAYYRQIELCGEKGKNPNDSICKYYPKTKKAQEEYQKTMDPQLKYQRLDAITLTCTIVEQTLFSILQYGSPLLIILAVVGVLHKNFSTGMIQNYLLRIRYNEFFKSNIKAILKIALLIPASLIFIFIMSCCLTKFNFQISQSTKALAVYSSFKYNHFLLYGIVICLLQFLLSFTYGCIGFICFKKNRNSIVSWIVGYVSTLGLFLFIYLIVYVVLINKILGFKELSEYFLISGYWFFNQSISIPAVVLIASIISLFTYIFTKKIYHKKEETMLENEKQIA